MIIGILRESGAEKRVAMLPSEAAGLKKLGVDVIVENDAGRNAFTSDESYNVAGIVTSSRKDILARSALLLSVNPVPEDDLQSCREGQVL